jgi:hypothetical protein
MAASLFQRVDSLPVEWQQWAQGWKYFKQITITEPKGEQRNSEPVEVLLSFPDDQVNSLAREVRLARLDAGKLIEGTESDIWRGAADQ